ncbi:MAG: response regulator transcription factor [Magnetococcales bacterium]|nr:response regulator transcription factor [Magnetococcales bacterium]
MPNLILIVDDEKDLLDSLQYSLEKEGYQTRTALNGSEALQEAFREPVPDLILLDLMLPDITGLDVCRQLRAHPATRLIPVVMLTAKGEEIDRVVGFEVGADDYVVKPFFVRELILRISAILRRPKAQTATTKGVVFGRIRLDRAGHRVWVDEKETFLTPLEFRLLDTLLSRKGRVQSRATLLEAVWGIRADVQTRTVDAHVNRLREKLGSVGHYVETQRGIGYRFRSSPDDES